MRTFLRIILKPLSFLPAICMMYLIFSFSAQDGVTSAQLSYKVSYKIVEVGGELLGADFEPWEIENLASRFHGPIRKIAHMTEYFALAVSVAFPLYVYGLRGFPLMLVAGLFCVAFACGDEYHQASVSGRSPSKRDVLIDSFGVFWGVVLVRIVGWTGRKTIFRPLAKKKKKKQENYSEVHNLPPYQNAYQPDYRDAAPRNSYYGNSFYDEPAPSVYPPNSAPYAAPDAGYHQNRSGQPYNYNGGSPSPYNHQNMPYYDDQNVYSSENSDSLSEDMSFRKLMSDLKDQKKASYSEKKFARKPKVHGDELPTAEVESDD